MVPAGVESAQSLVSALKHLESGEDAPNRITDATQLAASPQGKSLTKYPRKQIATRHQENRRFHEQVTGYGRSRVASHLVPAVSSEEEPATGYEPSLFSVGQVLPLVQR